ncbi:hypothetical protein BBJ41_01025 [Burkholderia stabilis]|nr:hypothetical protein BBJ41_01025 [Burkholderia stabilis]
MGALFNAQTSNLENCMNDKPYANGAMIKMLVNVFGVSPNEYESEHEQTLLHYAAWAGNAEAAQALIELGAEVDAKTLDGHTPLLFAVQQRSVDTVRVLIEAGADANAWDESNRSILDHLFVDNMVETTRRNDLRVIRLLLDGGADPTLGLTFALGEDHGLGVRAMMRAGADVQAARVDVGDQAGACALRQVDILRARREKNQADNRP